MSEVEQQKIQGYRKNRYVLNVVFTVVKLAIAYSLIVYTNYGLFIVIGYLLYALENTRGIQFINSQEINLQLNIIHQKINDLENKTSENKEHIENINFSHKCLSNSIIYHLHASGTSHMNRIWKTYQVEVKNEWPVDEKKWPTYLPIDGNPELKLSEIDEDDYSVWAQRTKGNDYKNNPNMVIDYDYVYELDK